MKDNKNSKQRLKTSMALDIGLMKEVGHVCIDLGIDRADAIELALKDWLYSKSAKGNPSMVPREYPQETHTNTIEYAGTRGKINPSEHSGWIAMLDRILSSGHAVAIEAIIRNLYAFDMLASSETGVKLDDFSVRSPEQIQVDIARVLAKHGRTTETEKRDELEPDSLAG